MKLRRWGICSTSEGTSVEPSRAGSRRKCRLSKMISTTCLIFPPGDFSWQPPAELAGAGAAFGEAAAPDEAAHAGINGYQARTNAVLIARAWRQLAVITCKKERNCMDLLPSWSDIAATRAGQTLLGPRQVGVVTAEQNSRE